MGCDGGTIPKRDELVKTRKKPEQKDKDSERLYRWKHCSVSQTMLRKPIVACELGRLYNKDEVIQRLLNKSNEPSMQHVKSLKDVKELRLTPNPSFKESASLGDHYLPTQMAEFICPVTSQEMNGKSGFAFIWTCGCVVSETALKEVKSDTCHLCNMPYLKDDVIPLNPNIEKIPVLEECMRERRAKAKAAKKSKRAAEGGVISEPKKKKIVHNTVTASSSKKPSVVSGDAASVLRTEEFNKLCSEKYSVASDPNKSEVYKSIFNTHESAKGKTKAHWVTCNPQYF